MKYLTHLAKDKKLKKILSIEIRKIELQNNIALCLIRGIVGQQLSTKVALVIYNRFLALYDGEFPSLQNIVDTPFETLRGIGFSTAKANYVQNVAVFFIEHKLTDENIHALSDEDAMRLLTQIKGIGKWTVEMLLMFALARKDVFSVDDFGIQKAMCKLYKLDMNNKKEMKTKMLRIANKWKPYRTYACLYLWAWKDK